MLLLLLAVVVPLCRALATRHLSSKVGNAIQGRHGNQWVPMPSLSRACVCVHVCARARVRECVRACVCKVS